MQGLDDAAERYAEKAETRYHTGSEAEQHCDGLSLELLPQQAGTQRNRTRDADSCRGTGKRANAEHGPSVRMRHEG